MIGLAVGIDYSLFIVTKHRTQVAQGMEVRESIARASATAGGAVLFAGGTVAISLLALVVAGIPLVTTLGYTSAIAVVFAILAALTLLPALFAVLGSHVSAIQLPFGQAPRRRGAVAALDEGGDGDHESPLAGDDRGAGGAARALDTHPVDAARPGGLGRGADRHDRSPGLRPDHEGIRGGHERAVPDLCPAEQAREAGPEEPQQIAQNEKQLQSSSSRSSSARRRASTPAAGAAAGDAADAAAVQRARQQEEAGRLAGDRPAPPDPPERPPEDQGRQVGDAAARQHEGNRRGLHADSHDAPSDLKTEDLVSRLRDTTIPKATKGQGMTAFVGGTTAAYVDLADKISSKLPPGHPGRRRAQLPGAAGRVPIDGPAHAGGRDEPRLGRARRTACSRSSSRRALPSESVGLDSAIPVVSFVPLIMFAILFGLSTDYQVFLLTQIQEHFKEGKGARRP